MDVINSEMTIDYSEGPYLIKSVPVNLPVYILPVKSWGTEQMDEIDC